MIETGSRAGVSHECLMIICGKVMCFRLLSLISNTYQDLCATINPSKIKPKPIDLTMTTTTGMKVCICGGQKDALLRRANIKKFHTRFL